MWKTRNVSLVVSLAAVAGLVLSVAAHAAPTNVRLTNDNSGYVSNYTMVTGNSYSDEVLDACSSSRGRQNEPAIAVDPRNPDVLVGGANDYCGVFNQDGTLIGPGGVVWMGYYRSEDGGASFTSSLIPGYPGDTSPYASNAHVRTAGAGDPVYAWDTHGRLFGGSESSGDRAGTAKGFGDVWVGTFENPAGPDGDTVDDGKQFAQSVTVGEGSSAPGIGGKFNDKTAIEADRTGGACDGIVYFAWSRFTGGGPSGYNSSVYVVRSTDHGKTFSAPVKISQTVHDIQFPDIAITHSGTVYITYRQFADVRSHTLTDGIAYNVSTDCGATFSRPSLITAFTPYDPTDVSDPQAPGAEPARTGKKAPEEPADDVGEADAAEPVPGSITTDCGDFDSHCASGYTFMRAGTQIRSSSDQSGSDESVYLVYDPTIPGTEVDSGTTFGTVSSEDLPVEHKIYKGSQSGIYLIRLDGATGTHSDPMLVDDRTGQTGNQIFPDISVDQGSVHVIWWDSRNDSCFDPRRPIGNCADGSTVPALDAFASSASTADLAFGDAVRLSSETSNPNFEQFSGRTVPFGGDYLYVSSVGGFAYGAWTDWRDVVAGDDPREGGDGDSDGADVRQCREARPDGSFSSDKCPWEGGLDQNIYGAAMP
jgi:hypothetical protein